MSPVHIDELNPETRPRVLKLISGPEGGALSALVTVEESITLGEPAGVHLTKSGLTFSRAISIEEWTDFGKNLKKIEAALQWWIGDWLNYGEKKYGNKYTEALQLLEYEEKSLRNISSISKRIEMSRRRDNLSWSHHAEVAVLEPENQTKLLDWAEKEKVSVKELRTEVKRQNQPKPSPNPTEIRNLREWIKVECPALDIVVQEHVQYGAESKTFDLESRDLTADEVKSICELLRESRSERKVAA
jgi:hypothetical protein